MNDKTRDFFFLHNFECRTTIVGLRRIIGQRPFPAFAKATDWERKEIHVLSGRLEYFEC